MKTIQDLQAANESRRTGDCVTGIGNNSFPGPVKHPSKVTHGTMDENAVERAYPTGDAFSEGDHPRDATGKFGSGGGGKSGETKAVIERGNERTDRAEQAKKEAHLKTPEGEKERQERNAAVSNRMREERAKKSS